MSRKSSIIIALASAVLLTLLAVAALLRTQEEPVIPAAAPAVQPDSDYGTGKVIINEFMEKNRAVIADSYGDFSDWIELKNISDETVNLGGFRLSDRENKYWTLPEYELGPGELLLIFASGRDSANGELHTDFSLKETETVYLKNPSGVLCDKAACMESAADVSVIRTEDGGHEQCLYPTPGFENDEDGYECFQHTLTASGPLQINEVMVSNSAVYGDYIHGYCDWVELKNISSAPVMLSDYYLSDTHNNYRLWRLPERELAPGELFMVLCDGRNDRNDTLPGASFSLNSENEQLYLCSDECIIDFASLRDIPYEGSFGRMDGAEGWFYFFSPTPEHDNSGGVRRIPLSPVTLTPDGIYDNVSAVEVRLAGGGTLRYTLDGSLPDEDSALYTEPIVLKKTTVVRAVSFDDNGAPSRAASFTYIINEHHSLPVLSLTTDSPSDFSGIYWGAQKNIETPGSISLYKPEGCCFTIGCGISMNGETSLAMLKKNMSLRFRGSYGAETLNYDIYGGGVQEFTNLLLRSGQDYDYAIVRNELCQALCERATDSVINQRSIWCVLYINGEYSGLYTLKEKANEQLYASLAGVSADSVELYEASVPYDTELYSDVINFCLINDMGVDENYRLLCERLDIDSLIDWTIMESFCANLDLTEGNLRYVRSSENDGKWRLMFYDLDSTFSTAGGGFVNLLSDFAFENRQVSGILCRLKANESFRDRFLTRAAELLSTVLTNEAVLEELDRQCGIIADEVERDISRYTRTLEQWEANKQSIRDFIAGENYGTSWRQYNIDTLCEIFELTAQEREHYFGEIDGK